MTLHIYPQDEGTGADNGDWIDAASIAQLVHSPNDVDYIVSGFEISNIVHGSTATIDVNSGVAKLYKQQMATAQYSDQPIEGRSETTVVVEEDEGFNEVNVEDGVVNHVFLRVSFSANDTGAIVTNTSGDNPAGLTLKIGTVDMADNTISYTNPYPDARFGTVQKDTAFMGQLSSTPPSSDIPADSTALYTKTDGNLYKKPSGGSEVSVSRSEEEVQDIIGGILGNGLNYDDANNEITADVGVSASDKQATTTHPIPMSELADTDWVDYPIRVPSGKTVNVWKWGGRTDTQSTPSGLVVGLYNYDTESYVGSANTAYATGSPLVSHDGAADLALRLENSSGGTVNAGADFSVTIE